MTHELVKSVSSVGAVSSGGAVAMEKKRLIQNVVLELTFTTLHILCSYEMLSSARSTALSLHTNVAIRGGSEES